MIAFIYKIAICATAICLAACNGPARQSDENPVMQDGASLARQIDESPAMQDRPSRATPAPEAPPEEVAALLEAAGKDIDGQNFDEAMAKALKALDISQQQGSALGQVRALACIVGTDIMSSRDEDAWKNAVKAEEIARRNGFDKELAGILISKAKLCSYAEISPDTGRNDEGLEYAAEALELAKKAASPELEAEACYITGSLLINKNRWNSPIDKQTYLAAGQWLDKGQAIADSCNIPRLKRNGILFRSRWFQQGGRNHEAISYFEAALQGLSPDDHLTAAAIDDRLVRLYTRVGDHDKALDAHDDYVYRNQKYILQKQDETLQEMQTRFEVQEQERLLEHKRYQTAMLALALVIALVIIAIAIFRIREARRRADSLQQLSDSREQIIEFLAKDLRNPANAMTEAISNLSADAPTLPPDKIREKCHELTAVAKTINTEVADYVGEILVRRNEIIAGIGLTKRELEIIRLSAEGLRASEIAERTHISVHTVNTHRQRIYSKMDVKNVTDMLRRANELGII